MKRAAERARNNPAWTAAAAADADAVYVEPAGCTSISLGKHTAGFLREISHEDGDEVVCARRTAAERNKLMKNSNPSKVILRGIMAPKCVGARDISADTQRARSS